MTTYRLKPNLQHVSCIWNYVPSHFFVHARTLLTLTLACVLNIHSHHARSWNGSSPSLYIRHSYVRAVCIYVRCSTIPVAHYHVVPYADASNKSTHLTLTHSLRTRLLGGESSVKPRSVHSVHAHHKKTNKKNKQNKKVRCLERRGRDENFTRRHCGRHALE